MAWGTLVFSLGRRWRARVYRTSRRSRGEDAATSEHEGRPRSATDPVDNRVLTALAAVERVAYALVSPASLADLGEGALKQVRETLQLSVAAMYVVDADRSAEAARDGARFRRFMSSEDGRASTRARDRVELDAEAAALLSAAGAPLVFREAAAWLTPNPFEPPAAAWLVLPLRADGAMVGIVIGAAPEPIALDPVGAMTLTSLGELLSAGIETARLRMEIQRTAVQRERMRLAADLHDGLAQNLALAVREIALLESQPPGPIAEASRGRLREAVQSAHRVVRAGLEDLSVVVPVGGVGAAVEELCARFLRRGMNVDIDIPGRCPDVAPEVLSTVLRVTQEALTNVERHAESTQAHVHLSVLNEALKLEITDDGRGIGPGGLPAPGDGHFGVWIMRERARSVGGAAEIVTRPTGGTSVMLTVPLRGSTQ